MSLMLRKSCEQLLVEANLAEFHAGIDERSKYMMLYTPCGKRFAVVHGVVFSRLQPTKAEIEYATMLLADWLARNEKLIEKYVDAWVEMKAMPKPEDEIETDTYKIAIRQVSSYHSSYRDAPLRGVTVVYNNIQYAFNMDFSLHSVDWKDSLPPSDWVKLIKMPPAKVMAHVEKYLQDFEKYVKLTLITEDIHEQLNTCSD